MIRESYCCIHLHLKENDSVINGEHSKSFIKFYIHPNSNYEERWILQTSETEEPKVFNIIKKPIKGRNTIEIEMDTLRTVTRSVLADMVSVIVPPVEDQDWLAGQILSLSREKIAERATRIRNKSVEIGVGLKVVDLILTEEVMKVIEEQEREGEQQGGGMARASLSSIMELRQGRELVVEKTTSKRCPICWEGYLEGKSSVIRMQCSHEFHDKCIIEWLLRGNSCPMCRFQLPTDPIQRFLWEY